MSTFKLPRGCGCTPKENSDTKVAQAVIYFQATMQFQWCHSHKEHVFGQYLSNLTLLSDNYAI